MKKTLILAAVIAFASCAKNKETKVESENTVIETSTDTVNINTDTVGSTEAQKEADNTEVSTEDKAPAKVASQTSEQAAPKEDVKIEYASFGDKIAADKALTKEQMLAKYKSLKPGDTVAVKFKS